MSRIFFKTLHVKRILNYKKPTFWIMFLAVIICILLSVYFFTNPQKPSIDFKDIRINWAITTDYRPEQGVVEKELTRREIDDLHSHLKNLKIGRKDDDLKDLTPFFMIMVRSYEIGDFSLIGYESNAKITGLLYDNSYYYIDDDEFKKYLSDICAKSDITVAPREEKFVITKIDGDSVWAVSYDKESKTDGLHNFKILIKDINSDSEPKTGDILSVKFRTEALSAYSPYTSVIRIGNAEEK